MTSEPPHTSSCPANRGQEGFALLEGLVAIALLAGTMVAIYALVGNILDSASRVGRSNRSVQITMNAIEAMSGAGEGPRELLVRSAKQESQTVLVTVQDSGPGLDPTRLDHLFDAFYTTKPRGLGMGLAISRSIIEAHGGRLWATANDGKGATFRFALPIDGERPA